MKKVLSVVTLLALSVFLFAAEEKEVKAENTISASEFSGSVQQAMSNNDYLVTAGDIYSLTYAANGTPVNYTIAVDPTYKIRVSNLAVLDVYGKSYITVKKQVEEIVQKNYPLSGAQFVLLNPATFKVVVTGEVNATAERTAWALTRLSSVIGGTTTAYSSIRNITITSTNGKTKTCDLFLADRLGDLTQNPYVRPGDVITINRFDRKVTVTGSVERPGTYELKEGENLKELIENYGHGLAPRADTSRITLTHYISETTNLGEAVYLSEKDIKGNYTLKNYDSVEIPSYTLLRPVMFIEGALYVDSEENLTSSNRSILKFDDKTKYSSLIRNNAGLFSSQSADLSKAYIQRKDQIIPINISEIMFNADYNSDIIVEPFDTLIIPFRQLFVTVAGAVKAPGRFPYIPNRTADYYIGLAGGLDTDRNNKISSCKISDLDGKTLKYEDFITPECTITVPSNSFTYFFGKYAPIITTTASVISATVSILALFSKSGS